MTERATFGNATLRRFEEATEYHKRTGFTCFRSVGADARGRTIFAPESARPTRGNPTARHALLNARDRELRLKQLSRQIRLDEISRSLSRAARLAYLEREIETAKAARRGSATHFGVEIYSRAPYSGPLFR
jgi:hypothetical protein